MITGNEKAETRLSRKVNSAPLLLSGWFLEERGYCKQQRHLWSTHTPPSTHISAQVLVQRSAALRAPRLLNLRLAPPSRRDVSRRESERERGGQCWGTEFIQYYWDIYSLADRYGEPPIPAPVSDAALRQTLIQLHWGVGCALCIPPLRLSGERTQPRISPNKRLYNKIVSALSALWEVIGFFFFPFRSWIEVLRAGQATSDAHV